MTEQKNERAEIPTRTRGNKKDDAEANSWILNPDIAVFGMLSIGILFVLAEEFIFRWLPYKLSLLRQNKYYWVIGIASALIFAWVHSLTGLTKFDGLPTPQFVAGIYLWRFIPTGFRNVFWIHYLSNVFVVIFILLLLQLNNF